MSLNDNKPTYGTVPAEENSGTKGSRRASSSDSVPARKSIHGAFRIIASTRTPSTRRVCSSGGGGLLRARLRGSPASVRPKASRGTALRQGQQHHRGQRRARTTTSSWETARSSGWGRRLTTSQSPRSVVQPGGRRPRLEAVSKRWAAATAGAAPAADPNRDDFGSCGEHVGLGQSGRAAKARHQ